MLLFVYIIKYRSGIIFYTKKLEDVINTAGIRYELVTSYTYFTQNKRNIAFVSQY